MANVFIEHRQLVPGVALTWDLAHHLCIRHRNGPVIVVAAKPPAIIPALRKQWLRVIHKLRREYSSTLNAPLKDRLSHVIASMELLRFEVYQPEAAKPPGSRILYFVRPEHLPDLPFSCRTIYVATELTPDLAKTLGTKLYRYGLLVDYKAKIWSVD